MRCGARDERTVTVGWARGLARGDAHWADTGRLPARRVGKRLPGGERMIAVNTVVGDLLPSEFGSALLASVGAALRADSPDAPATHAEAVRRDAPGADHTCRLKCGSLNESMLHMVECDHAKPLWKAAINFCKSVLGEKIETENSRLITAMVIFNIRMGDFKLISEPARALMRQVFNRYYTDVVHVAKFGTIFKWQVTFRRALLNYCDAALRWSHGIRRLNVHRRHTHLTAV